MTSLPFNVASNVRGLTCLPVYWHSLTSVNVTFTSDVFAGVIVKLADAVPEYFPITPFTVTVPVPTSLLFVMLTCSYSPLVSYIALSYRAIAPSSTVYVGVILPPVYT